MNQIKILGAGISGLTAAINLAKAGYSVKVFEKNADVGLSHKLDFEGLENWTCDIMQTIRNTGVKTNFKNKPFYEATWYSPAFRKAEIKSEEPFFYLVERGGKNSVEYALKEQALDAGVEIGFNAKMDADDCDIISAGAKSADAFAIGSVFENAKHEDCVIAFLSDKMSPKLYFYITVWGGRACIVTLSRKQKIDIRALHAKNLKLDIVQDVIMNAKKMHDFGGFVNFRVPDSAILDGKLLTGEAAGFQDAFLGFGMKFAFLSGHFAAKSIIDGAPYDALWKEGFMAELKKSQCSRLVMDALGDSIYEKAVSYMQKNPDCRSRLNRIYCNYDWKYKLLYQISKMKYCLQLPQ